MKFYQATCAPQSNVRTPVAGGFGRRAFLANAALTFIVGCSQDCRQNGCADDSAVEPAKDRAGGYTSKDKPVVPATRTPDVRLVAEQGGLGADFVRRVFLDDRRVITVQHDAGFREEATYAKSVHHWVHRLGPAQWQRFNNLLASADAGPASSTYDQEGILDGGYTNLLVRRGQRHITIINRPKDLPSHLRELEKLATEFEPRQDALAAAGPSRLLVRFSVRVPEEAWYETLIFADGMAIMIVDSNGQRFADAKHSTVLLRLLPPTTLAQVRGAIAGADLSKLKPFTIDPDKTEGLIYGISVAGARLERSAKTEDAAAPVITVLEQVRQLFPAAEPTTQTP